MLKLQAKPSLKPQFIIVLKLHSCLILQLNGPAPECEPSGCLTCQEDFRKDFDRIAGIEFPKAGITERIAHSCSDFYRVIHDPCLGLDGPEDPDPSPADSPDEEDGPAVLPEPTRDDAGSAGNYIDTPRFVMAVTLTLSLFGMVLVLD